jgi:hypothetical protein
MYRSFGVLNTSQPYASSRSRDAKFTSEAVKRNTLIKERLREPRGMIQVQLVRDAQVRTGNARCNSISIGICLYNTRQFSEYIL